MRTFLWKCLVVVALTLLPRITSAQCMGSSGGDHDHGASTATRSERKSEKTVRDLLSDDRSRQLLMEAILADSRFMRDLIGRISEVPEWRALAAERAGFRAAGPDVVQDGSSARPGSSAGHQGSSHYTCPMHPEIQSRQPGRCPKCGMELQRAD